MEENILSLKSLDLLNYRGFQNLHIDFSSQLTCIAGINGAGKTSVLDAIALCLSWIIARAKTQNGKGWTVDKQFDLRIPEGTKESFSSSFVQQFTMEGYISGQFSFFDKPLKVKQSFAALGWKSESNSDYASLSSVFDYVNSYMQKNPAPFNLPVMVYYPTNRSVIDIPVRIRMQHAFDQFSTYEHALDSSARFRDFFEWYRDREDIENAKKTELRDFDYTDSLLNAVRAAIYICMPGYKNLHIQRTPQLMMIEKNNVELPINTLSDGEKCLFSLVGDLARRLAIASPNLKNPLHGSGIVLIDEIDLHLHPSWQRKVSHLLKKTFPNCQFIITSHSPQVLGELPPSDVIILNNNAVYKPSQTFGLTSNDILSSIMDYDENAASMVRNEEIETLLKKLAGYIDAEDFIQAKELISQIEKLTNGQIPETEMYKAEIDMLLGNKTDDSNT